MTGETKPKTHKGYYLEEILLQFVNKYGCQVGGLHTVSVPKEFQRTNHVNGMMDFCRQHGYAFYSPDKRKFLK